MATYREHLTEAETIEKLANDAEISLAAEIAKKDLKEKRKLIKQTLFGGSNKLKHLIPKGKHL